MDYPKIEISGGDNLRISKTQLIDLIDTEINTRTGGELGDKAIYLPEKIKGIMVDRWIIARDEHDLLCAVPLLDK